MKKKRHLFLLFAVVIAAGWGMFVLSKSKDKIGENEMVMYSAIAGKVAALDPGNIGDTSSSAVASQIFECLYDYHYKQIKQSHPLLPPPEEGR